MFSKGEDFTVGPRIDGIWVTDEWRQSTADESFLQSFRALSEIPVLANDVKLGANTRSDTQFRQISGSAKAAKALADDAPFALVLRILLCQAMTDSFTVADDVVCAEFLEILGLFDCVPLTSKGSCRNG